MYSYFKGILTEKEEGLCVVETGGVGYNILVGGAVLERLPAAGNEVKLYTYTSVREDTIQLFGFLTKEDVRLFRLLIGVSGIGPKGAQAILSQMSADDLRFAILSEDQGAIAKTPGIGKKTAQKLILELKDKLKLGETETIGTGETNAVMTGMSDARTEAVQALTALGYSPTDALAAVRKSALPEDATVEELLKEALRQMALL